MRGTTPDVQVLPRLDEEVTGALLAAWEPQARDQAFEVVARADLAEFLTVNRGAALAYDSTLTTG